MELRTRYTHLLFWGCLAIAVGVGWTARAAETAEPDVDFAREIQPLLARRCFSCHGPDKAEGGLRLNRRETAIGKLESGDVAVVPGKPGESQLLTRVTAKDPSLRMPPEGKPLTADEAERLRRWIAQGAKWTSHWAFEPPVARTPPSVKRADWVRNPIDAFVLAKLEARGLHPSPPAAKAHLLRRVTFDLTGLPPTPAETEAFLADARPDAFERVVDRLLASPRYGERWARHWLDVVRYADTNSFERDGLKPHSWRYRDYVIRSLNDDKPYDQFLKEQIAGDELTPVTNDGLIATGFYRLGLWDDEPADRMLAKFDGLDDIVTTIGQGMLGLTVNCARCHDHKIDPITQKDYYSFVAFFHNIRPMAGGGPNIEVPIYSDGKSRTAHEAALKRHDAELNTAQADLTALETTFRDAVRAAATGSASKPRDIASDLDDLEYRYYRDTFTKLPDFDNLKAETVDKLPRGLFDIRVATREDNFGFVFLGQLKVPTDGDYTFSVDSDDGSRLSLNGKEVLLYDGIHGVGKPQTVKVSLKAGRTLIRLDYFQGRFGKGLIVKWSGPGVESRYLSATTEADDKKTNIKPAAETGPIADQIRNRGAKLLGTEFVEAFQRAKGRLDELKKSRPTAEMALCVTENGAGAPDTFILARGNPLAPGAKVTPAYIEVLGGGEAKLRAPLASATSSGRRLAFAEWIASPENRLTGRVFVNRLWQHHFGRGIVRSPNNFGQLGDPPTHPELLDWLAAEFVRGGFRVKAMHKLMLLSNTYQLSAEAQPEALASDPANDLFWRFNMRRLGAEEVHDALLAVSGRLNTKMYGPGFFPKISAEVLAGQSRPGAGWGNSPVEERSRRSVYIHVKRSLITPILSSFDFPDTDSSCEARFTTTQPGQALAMLNGEFVTTQADVLAERVQKEGGPDTKSRLALALRLALSRTPTDAEIQRAVDLHAKLQAEHHFNEPDALRTACLYVLNLNEFLFVD